MTAPVQHAAVWKRGLAATLDFFTVFFVAGYIIGHLTGMTSEAGFNLTGRPAFALFGVIIAYFLICRRLLGGTLWDRILRIGRPQPVD